MITLRDTMGANFIWIDHHVTAIDRHQDDGINGLLSTGLSACELCWQFFFGENDMPWGVKLLGIYDTWRKDEDDWRNGIGLNYAYRGCDTDPAEFDTLRAIFGMQNFQVSQIANQGLKVYDGIREFLEKYAEPNAWKTRLRCPESGNHHMAVVLNTPINNSICLEPLADKWGVDLMVVFNQFPENGTLNWKVSIYSRTDDFHAGKFCEQHGGGGHQGAAGCAFGVRAEMDWLNPYIADAAG